MSLRFNSCGNVDCTCSNHTKVPEYSMSDQVRANALPQRKLASPSNSKSEDNLYEMLDAFALEYLEAQSEAPSVDSQIDEVFDWLLALYIDTDDAYMVEEMEEDRPIFRAKINRLIIEAELRGFDKAFDSHDYDGLREYRAALSNNLSKGKDNEG